MKRPRLFVLLFYHIITLFATNAVVSKTQQTATPVDSLAHFSSFHYFYEIFSYLSAWGWGCWESGLVCQRRAAILNEWENDYSYKIPARPRGGQTFDRLRFTLPFRLRRKVQMCTGNVPL